MPSRPRVLPRAVADPPPPPSQPGRDGNTRYTVLNAKILVETEHLSASEHDRVVQWMISRIKNSTSAAQRGFVMVVVYDEKFNHILGSDSAGMKSASSDTGEILSDLFTTNQVA
jgi:hypothetical protein